MRIDIQKFKSVGYIIETDGKTFIDIFPKDGKNYFQMFHDEFKLPRMYAYDMEERLHMYQIIALMIE